MAFMRPNPQADEYVPPRMTDAQMRELERVIARAPEATTFAKKVLVWMLRQTNNLTRGVKLGLPDAIYGRQLVLNVQDGVHNMLSSGAQTPLGVFMRERLGTEASFFHHHGLYRKDNEHLPGKGSTIWISHVFYDERADMLARPTSDEIEAVVLPM